MFTSFYQGLLAATRNWKLVLMLAAASILFAIPLAIPVFLLITTTTAETAAARAMLANNLDPAWTIDLFNRQFAGFSLESFGIQFAVGLAIMGIGYLLINIFFAGGILEVFSSADGAFTMRKFWAGGGAHFWRFARLTLISLLFYAIPVIIYSAVNRGWIARADKQAEAYSSVVYKSWFNLVLLLLLLALVNMIFDYARIVAVLEDSRKMFRTTFRALAFSLRNIAGTCILYLLIAAVGIALFFGFASIRSAIPQNGLGSAFVAFLLAQVAMASRMWNRLNFYGSQLLYYREQTRPREAEIDIKAPLKIDIPEEPVPSMEPAPAPEPPPARPSRPADEFPFGDNIEG